MNKKIVSIHQPEHLCWLGILDKISKSDEFVIMDDVNFRKNYFQNRNKIRTPQGWQWLTVPVEKHNHKSIKDIKISYDSNWQKNYLKSIEFNYKFAPYFSRYYPIIEQSINSKFEYLVNLNFHLLNFILTEFEINTPIKTMSQLGIINADNGSDKVLEICKKTNADIYLSGSFGKDYLKIDKFKQNNIEIIYHRFFHPYYKQTFKGFEVGMSAIDLLFNYGDRVKDILKAKGKICLEEILKNYNYQNMKILEMFGNDGSGHLSIYGNGCNNLTIWELDEEKCLKLKKKFPNANIYNVDSLYEKHFHKKEFDIVIVDMPSEGWTYTDEIIPKSVQMLKDEGVIIFLIFKKPYNLIESIKKGRQQYYKAENVEDLSLDFLLKFYDEKFNKDFIIKKRQSYIREFVGIDEYLYNFVYELKRRNK